MRRLFIALLIALLPLRGWVGDAMALTLTLPPPASSSALTSVSGHSHGPLAEHCGHAADARDVSDTSPPNGHTGDFHGTCSACDVCNGPALTAEAVVSAASHLPHAGPLNSASHFASSDRKPTLKPPIS